jgi:hypothetical protein
VNLIGDSHIVIIFLNFDFQFFFVVKLQFSSNIFRQTWLGTWSLEFFVIFAPFFKVRTQEPGPNREPVCSY